MATLVYAPEVTVRIRTAPNSRGKGKIIDVTEDMVSGSLTRVTKGLSTTEFTILNQSRKYDGMFSPMDTVVVYLRRVKPLLKFAGYLDAVPLWSAVPGSINLRASCTLKRLQNFMWDPGSAAAVDLLSAAAVDSADGNRMNDGGSARRALDVLTNVAGWPEGQVHIGRIPDDWYKKVASVADALIAEAEALQMAATLGAGATVNGVNPLTDASSQIPGIGPGTGTMPATSGKCSSFGGPNGGAYGPFALTGEDGSHPKDNLYCAMRWPYVNEDLTRKPKVNISEAKAWWANRHILVVNPKNNKAVVVRAADWGPNINTGRVIDLSPHALSVLGAKTDQVLHMGFAPANTNLGKVSATDASLGTVVSGSATGASGISSGWGRAGDTANMVKAKAAGITFTVHRQARPNFEGFVNDLVSELGYHPKKISGFNNRNIRGTNKPSNHAYGAAIDIDSDKNPRYDSAAGGRYALPKPPPIINLARKWGLGWGGEYQNSKDYMHFEVIGAPASNVAAYRGAVTGAGAVVVHKWKPPIHKPPGYRVTSHFGDGGAHWVSGTHSGTDFACASGTKIHPVGPGTVSDHGTGHASYGNWVSINHGNKVWTFYAHMNAASPVAVGTSVTQSSVIGHVGMTGNATGPHVHVELRKGADTYTAATQSGGIEKYVLGGANRSDPPAGVQAVEGDYGSSSAASSGLDVAAVGQGLFNVWQFDLAKTSYESNLLGGYRALLNDVPVLDTISQYMQSALRDYCSAPNGDFIAWFPDYFGHYKQAGKMVVSKLEIAMQTGPPTIGWSDENLKTHQFVSSATNAGLADASEVVRTASTAGIASVEFPELMQALLNVTKTEAEDMRDNYLSRYGARVEFTPMNNISGPRQEFFFACHLFMQNWSQQYQARVNLTFMPEVFPGMLLCLPVYGIQGYVTETRDAWDLNEGGGFTTDVTCAPWSAIGGSKVVASVNLPRGAPL